MRELIARTGIIVYAALLALSPLILASDGGMVGFYSLMAACAVAGFAARRWPVRIVAVAAVLLALGLAARDFRAGQSLQSRLQKTRASAATTSTARPASQTGEPVWTSATLSLYVPRPGAQRDQLVRINVPDVNAFMRFFPKAGMGQNSGIFAGKDRVREIYVEAIASDGAKHVIMVDDDLKHWNEGRGSWALSPEFGEYLDREVARVAAGGKTRNGDAASNN